GMWIAYLILGMQSTFPVIKGFCRIKIFMLIREVKDFQIGLQLLIRIIVERAHFENSVITETENIQIVPQRSLAFSEIGKPKVWPVKIHCSLKRLKLYLIGKFFMALIIN